MILELPQSGNERVIPVFTSLDWGWTFYVEVMFAFTEGIPIPVWFNTYVYFMSWFPFMTPLPVQVSLKYRVISGYSLSVSDKAHFELSVACIVIYSELECGWIM